MLIVGALCALLLVAGNWPMRACAAVVAAWFTYAQAASSSAGRGLGPRVHRHRSPDDSRPPPFAIGPPQRGSNLPRENMS